MKAIPIIILYNIVITWDDLYFSIGVFLVYLIWLDINDTNFFMVYQKLINNYINNHTNTFVSNLYDNIYNKLNYL
jgi:hypothetical protein